MTPDEPLYTITLVLTAAQLAIVFKLLRDLHILKTPRQKGT
jgi:hypothetical protein